MKKGGKVILGILIAAAVLAAVGFVMTRIVDHKLHKALADIPGAKIEFSKVNLSPIFGNLEFRDVEFELTDSTGQVIQGSIEKIWLERLHWRSFLKGEARADKLLIKEPSINLILSGQTVEKKDTSAAAPSPLKLIALEELKVEKGRIGLGNLKDSTRVSAEGIAFSARDIGVQLPEGLLEYNDSSYFFALDSLHFRDAAALSKVEVGHLETADAGPILARAMHIYSCVGKEKVAERMGKVAAMWFDIKLDSLCTSPLNIPRMARSQSVNIEKVHFSSPGIVIFQDDRYPPAVPYPTFQESLNQVEMPIKVDAIDASIKTFTFIWETTHINRGTFPLHNLRLSVGSASNAPGNLMKIGIKSGNSTTGRLDLSMAVHNDKPETTGGSMHITGLDASRLDPFVRPLFGATAKANFHQIDCTFKGNKSNMTTDFSMLYDNLALHAWNDEGAPYKVVSKNSGAINFLASIIVPKSNPVVPGKEPKKVEASFARDPMQPYPAYIIQNLTQGMLKTVLPGGAVKKTE